MDAKRWYTSKTIWVNLIAIASVVLFNLTGTSMEAEEQAALATGILAVVNIVLRAVTKQPIN